jgi:hypothetical protein
VVRSTSPSFASVRDSRTAGQGGDDLGLLPTQARVVLLIVSIFVESFSSLPQTSRQLGHRIGAG